ncbi:MAG: pseudouridine synthase, partial [Thermomonas sp.]
IWLDRFARGLVQDAGGCALGVDAAYRVGLEVRYFREVPDEPRIPFEAHIVFADADLVVADKPHFLPVMPAGRFVAETLLARLRKQLDNPALVPLHRIDRETAGLVLFSARAETRAMYQSLFPQRTIEKTYEAIAPPLPSLSMPHVHRSHLQAGEPFFRMCEADGTSNSHTRIEVIERRANAWRYALQPVTGRKHQLRVHMAALGAPIINDSLYPALCPREPDDFSRPLQLLAKSLRFIDPIDGRPRAFESGQALSIDEYC